MGLRKGITEEKLMKCKLCKKHSGNKEYCCKKHEEDYLIIEGIGIRLARKHEEDDIMKFQWFVEHIENHLDTGEKVICKICGKDIDTIAEARWKELLQEVDKDLRRKK